MQKNLLSSNDSLYLPNGQKITLNEQQKEAVSLIKEFIKTKGERYFLLSGYAGTGKTTVIKKILDDYKGKSIVSAPTRKAVSVISQATMSEGFTIHALLGLQPDINLEDFNPNSPIFGQIKKASIQRYNLIIIDESSMINEALLTLIDDEVEKSITTKVIFLGDEAQIPPVGEKLSVIFDFENNYQLTQLMRQSQDNPVSVLTAELRNYHDDLPDFLQKRQTSLNDSDEGILFIESNDDFRAQIEKVFRSSYAKTDVNYAKLIAWRNRTVMMSNKIIRELVFGKNANIIEKGDVLTGYKSIKGNSKESFLINNCVDYKVSDVSARQKNSNGLFGYTVKILEKSKLFKGYDEKRVFILDSNDEDNLHSYAEIQDSLLAVAKADRLWNVYYDFRKKNLLMTDIERYRNGDVRAKDKHIKKDLDYGFAITAHKSQGSTYQKTFILLKDVLLNNNAKERNQMLYVAMTRAQKQVIVL